MPTTATVTCRTEGCMCEGAAVSVPVSWVDDEGQDQPIDYVVCGACGQTISDVTTEKGKP